MKTCIGERKASRMFEAAPVCAAEFATPFKISNHKAVPPPAKTFAGFYPQAKVGGIGGNKFTS